MTILHVVAHEFEYIAEIEYRPGMTIEEFLTTRDTALQRRLGDLVKGAPDFCRVEARMVHGKPWREVLRVAADEQSDLITYLLSLTFGESS